jgi:hypothetical protein
VYGPLPVTEHGRSAARSVLLVGKNPERESHRALCQTKNNLAPRLEGSLGFEIQAGPRLVWTGDSSLTVETMLSYKQSESVDERSAKSEAVKFLEDLLRDGPMGSKAVYDAADQSGIAHRTIQRAKKDMRIISKKRSNLRRRMGLEIAHGGRLPVHEDRHRRSPRSPNSGRAWQPWQYWQPSHLALFLALGKMPRLRQR